MSKKKKRKDMKEDKTMENNENIEITENEKIQEVENADLPFAPILNKDSENVVVDSEVEHNQEDADKLVEELDGIAQVKMGKIKNCVKLNVRVAPSQSADVVYVVDSDETVYIYELDSTVDFYKVVTLTGVEGYCMRNFIEII